MKINKEGYRVVVIAFLLFTAICASCFIWTPLWVGWLVTGLLFIEFLFLASFFREPNRRRLHDSNIVFSPADGKVVVIEPVKEKEYLGDERIQVSVFMSITNVHVNWFPVSGKILYFKYHPGKFMVAWNPKSSENNERTTTVVETEKHKILFRQVAGYVARRIVSYAKVGENAEQNTKCGFIKFGSRIDIMLPPDSEILVKMGDKVTGSQTPLARLK